MESLGSWLMLGASRGGALILAVLAWTNAKGRVARRYLCFSGPDSTVVPCGG